MKKVDKAILEVWQRDFADFINVPLTLSFARFSFADVIIQELTIAAVSKMDNPPKKRDGKTPSVLQIITNAGKLNFVIEDVYVARVANGISIVVNDNLQVTLRK